MVRACAGVRQAAQLDELLEVLGHELRAVVGDDPRPLLRELLQGPLQDHHLVLLRHRGADLAMHDVAAVAIEDRRQVVERAAEVHVGDVDVPMLVRPGALLEIRAFPRRFPRLPTDPRCRLEHSVDAAGADRCHVAVEHHERQSAEAFQRVLEGEADDRFLLPLLQPPLARDPGVVLVKLAVTLLPVVELA